MQNGKTNFGRQKNVKKKMMKKSEQYVRDKKNLEKKVSEQKNVQEKLPYFQC